MTLGLVSFGAIARRVARKAKAFGFRIVAADPFLDDSVFAQEGVERVDMERLFKTADIISLHCPLVARDHSSHPAGDHRNHEARRANHQHLARRR